MGPFKELEWKLQATRPSRSISVSDLTNAILDVWAQLPTGTHQTLAESLPRRVETLYLEKGLFLGMKPFWDTQTAFLWSDFTQSI